VSEEQFKALVTLIGAFDRHYGRLEAIEIARNVLVEQNGYRGPGPATVTIQRKEG
jgi:hypothetical protein